MRNRTDKFFLTISESCDIIKSNIPARARTRGRTEKNGMKAVRSMTGFGRAQDVRGGKDVTVEIKSVNGRFFDCNVRIGRSFSYIEERIKPYLQSRGIERGKVDVSITIERVDGENTGIDLDTAYLEGYLKVLRRMRDEYGLVDDITVMNVAKNPSVFGTLTPEVDADAEWEDVKAVLDTAVDAHLAAREREGASLAKDLLLKLETVRGYVEKIGELSSESVERYRERLSERVREALADNRITPDESRLLTEVALFADRVCVDEELVRLRTHFGAMGKILSDGGAVGRKLDFLLQEMNREINTTGSKCNDAAIAALVVDTKCELEKMREQIQNLE